MSHADQSMIRWIDFAFWNRILKEKDQKNGPECWQESNRGSDSGQNQEEKRGNKYKKEDRSSGLYRNGNRCDHRFRNFRFTAHSDQWYWNRNCTGTAGDDCIHPVSYTHLDVYKRQEWDNQKDGVKIHWLFGTCLSVLWGKTVWFKREKISGK